MQVPVECTFNSVVHIVVQWFKIFECIYLKKYHFVNVSDAKRLYDDLLSNYNKLVRPVVNTSDVLKVSIKLKLSQLIDVVSFCSHLYRQLVKFIHMYISIRTIYWNYIIFVFNIYIDWLFNSLARVKLHIVLLYTNILTIHSIMANSTCFVFVAVQQNDTVSLDTGKSFRYE